MANPEHLKILKQGVEVWNRWREANPEVRPDLSGAEFVGFDLNGVNLNGVDCRQANLSTTKFRKASLKGAKLGISENSSQHTQNFAPFNSDINADDYFSVAMTSLARSVLNPAPQVSSLSPARLVLTDFTEANLNSADFSGANLQQAIFEKAELNKVNFYKAMLQGVDFTLANLSKTDLIYADLSMANLSGANLLEAKVGFTNLNDVDLGGIQNLETVKHFGPSTIDLKTLKLFKQEIPQLFLRRTGLHDIGLLDDAGRETATSPTFYSCFISYSSQDEDFAQCLHADLQQKGVRCWFAPEDMKIGDKLRSTIDQSIRIHDKLLIILSENSLNSEWVESEVEKAFEEERKRKQTVLFPVRLDEAVMETEESWAAEVRRTRHIGDFSRWKDHDAYQKAFEHLLRDLKAEG